MSGERNVSLSGRAKEARTPPHSTHPREITVLVNGSFEAVSQAELALFFKRMQGSARALRLQRAAALKAALSEAIADRRALRRLEKQLREFDRSANPRRRMRASPWEQEPPKISKPPTVTITRLSKPLPCYPAPIIDRQRRHGIFFHIEYDSARGNLFGVASRRIHYQMQEDHAELVEGRMICYSNMGNSPDEIKAGADVLETVSRAARKNAKLGFSAICQLSPNLDQKGRVRATKRLAAAFDRRGVPYCMTLHAPSPDGDQRNFHIHVWFSHRPMERVGPYEWAVATQLRSDLDGPDAMRDLRREWAEILSQVTRAQGERLVFTALSNAARGLSNMPLRKLDRQKVERARRGEIVADVEANRQIIAENCRLAESLRTRRKAPARYQAGPPAVPQTRSAGVNPRPALRSDRHVPVPIVARVLKPTAARRTQPAPTRSLTVSQALLALVADQPKTLSPKSTTPKPSAYPRSERVPSVTTVYPEARATSPRANPASLPTQTITCVSPSRPRIISVTPVPIAPTLRQAKPTQPLNPMPLSHRNLPTALWEPTSLERRRRPKSVIKSRSPICLRVDPPVLSRTRIVEPVDAILDPYREWGDGGAVRWLVEHGSEAMAAKKLYKRITDAEPLRAGFQGAPNPSNSDEAKEDDTSAVRSSRQIPDEPSPVGTAVGHEERRPSEPTLPQRIDRLGQSLGPTKMRENPSSAPTIEGEVELGPRRPDGSHEAPRTSERLPAQPDHEDESRIQLPPARRPIGDASGKHSDASATPVAHEVGQGEPDVRARLTDEKAPPPPAHQGKTVVEHPPRDQRQLKVNESGQLLKSDRNTWFANISANLRPLFDGTPLLAVWLDSLERNDEAEVQMLAGVLSSDPDTLRKVGAIEPLVGDMLRHYGQKAPIVEGPIRQAPEFDLKVSVSIPGKSSRLPGQSTGGRKHSPLDPSAMPSRYNLAWTPTGSELIDRWHAARTRGRVDRAEKLADEIAGNAEAIRVARQLDENWRKLLTQDLLRFRRRARSRSRSQPGRPPPSKER